MGIFKDMRDFETETNLWTPAMDKEFGINFLLQLPQSLSEWSVVTAI